MKPQYLEASSSLRSLRTRWVILAVVSVLTLMVGYALLQSQWQSAFATRWLVLTVLGFIYLLGILWIGLPENYREGENRLLPSFGAGNYLTILRGALIAALMGFLLAPRPEGWVAWIPGVSYSLAAIIDLFDGYVARLTRQTTRLGEILDLKLDGLGVLAAALLAARYGQVPAWYVLVGGARYLFVAGLWLRKRLGKPVHALPQSASRRPFAGAQMGFLAVALLPIFTPPGTYLAGILFAIPFLIGFARDWLLASGVLKPGPANPHKDAIWTAGSGRFFLQQWFPLILRTAAVFLTGVALASKLKVFAGFLQGSAPAGLNLTVTLILVLQMIGLALITLGAAGRTATLAILFSIGIQQRLAALTFMDVSLIIIATALFFLGTGPFSLWKPEDKIISKRLGEA
jgi:CDP-diacylglycerol--glycerol-3-phosphate 3-phosphatidyltransferase